ncbi:hypothetical protein GCK32_017885 [Trichostrongylus colubriformis]|uniref:Uncharacterized protein n=1 Tax=Trichostrongylus colubriformis TaxID=6319 RepID=A0AAN8IPK3_TRICO
MQAPAESKMITMEAIAKFMQNTVQKLEQLATQQEKNTELILVQIQKALNLTSTDRNGNVTVEPDAVTRARKRLQELEHVKTRTFAKKRTLLMRHDDNKPKCGFCRSVGMHDSDGCYKYTTAKSRKEVLANAALCENCLRLCPKPCKANTMCDYCGATNHNTAICEAPEEKRRCLQTVREWELLGKPPCIEEASSADISDVFTGPQCADALSWAEESSIKSVV